MGVEAGAAMGLPVGRHRMGVGMRQGQQQELQQGQRQQQEPRQGQGRQWGQKEGQGVVWPPPLVAAVASPGMRQAFSFPPR